MGWLEGVGGWLKDVDWQALATIVAMVGVIVGFYLTRSGQRQEREIAEATASRAEAAAGLTEQYTRRVVDALETIAQAGGLGGGPGPAVPEHVTWSLVHHQGDRYELENIGTSTAYDVEVTGHESLNGPNRFQGSATLRPGEAMTFIALRMLNTTDATITVTWSPHESAGPDERETWRYPLPSRPPRR